VTENRYTPPSPWCPNPQNWHADDADSTEHETTALAAAFVRALQPEVVIETGTYTAQTALAIGHALAANGHGHLYTVEIHPGLAETATALLAGLPVTVINAGSLQWLDGPCPPIGFAWIDSGDAATRAAEAQLIINHATPGAIIGIHDTAPHHNIWAAFTPLINAGKLTPIHIRSPRGATFAQVNP
jgi:predicted O-methyltransferase YrrM